MGPAGLAIMAVGTLMQYAGTMQQAKAADREGLNAVNMANYRAQQMEQNAGQAQAASQKEAAEERRKAALLASRGLAVAGASGGGVSDPTVLGLIADIEGEGAFRSAMQIYQGEDRAREFKQGALSARAEGDAAYASAKAKSRALKTSAFANAAMNVGGMYMKYGGGGVKPEQAPAPVEDRFFT